MYDAVGGLLDQDRAPVRPGGPVPVSDTDLHQLPAAVVGKDLLCISDRLGALNLELCRHVAVFDSKSGHVLDGHRTAAGWLAHHTGMSRSAAGQLVRIARRLRQLPVLSAAAEAGELSWEQTRTLATAASDASFETFTEIEAELVEACKHLTGDDTRRVVALWRKICAEADEKTLTDANHLCRALYVSRTFEGIYSISGTLDPEAGHIFEAGLQRLIDAQRRNEPADQLPEERRTLPQRRADAAVDMAKLACGWNPTRDNPVEDVIIDGTARPTIELVVDLDTLQRTGNGELCEYLDMSPLPAETARRICCEGTLERVLTRNSIPLDVGRQTRTPNRATRRALDLRDGGCAYPGCGTHPRLCEAHHITHWAHGGKTRPDNLVLLCWFHHHLMHEGQWNITLSDDTSRPVFEAPDGRLFPATPPRPELPRQLAARLRPDRD